MSRITGYITRYFRDECHIPFFCTILVYTALLVFFNFRYDYEDSHIKTDLDRTTRLLRYLGLYFVCFGVPYLLLVLFHRKDDKLRSPALWGMILFAITVFSVRAWFFQHSYWLRDMVPDAYRTVIYKYASNLAGFIFLFIPCFVFWLIADRRRQPLYGLKAKGTDVRPYFILLLCMVPLLLFAASKPDFQEVYPRAEHLNLHEGVKGYRSLTALYELCYSVDFAVVEFFFRGFLLLAFTRYAGAKALLPMCVFYVSIHFDKPLLECISSFFGGLILGIITYNTKSVYGGIIVHLGIALMMEALGFVF